MRVSKGGQQRDCGPPFETPRLARLLRVRKWLDQMADTTTKVVFDDPPAKLDINKIWKNEIDAKYLEKLTATNRCDNDVFFRVWSMFNDSLGGAYMAWFN